MYSLNLKPLRSGVFAAPPRDILAMLASAPVSSEGNPRPAALLMMRFINSSPERVLGSSSFFSTPTLIARLYKSSGVIEPSLVRSRLAASRLVAERLPVPKPPKLPSMISPVSLKARICSGKFDMNCTALKKAVGIWGLPMIFKKELSRPSGVGSTPKAETNSIPEIGVIRKSTKGFIGPTMPSIFSTIGSKTSLMSEPTSMRTNSKPTLGVDSCWPYSQCQPTTMSALSLGMPGMPPMSSTEARRTLVSTAKAKPIAPVENSLAAFRRPELSPLRSMPAKPVM